MTIRLKEFFVKNCPRKIRDKERSDVNEFLEWLFEKVSNCWLRRAGSNCDTRLNNLVNIVVFLLYAVVTLIMVFHHEIWRDEAQAWLVVRDLNIIEMAQHVRTEGHPLLWYFVILPLTKIFQGFYAVFSMQILNWFLVVLGMGIFVFK